MNKINYSTVIKVVSALLTHCCLDDNIEKNEMGRACSTRGEVYTRFWWGNLRKRDKLGDQGIDGRIILRWIFRKLDVGIWTGSNE